MKEELLKRLDIFASKLGVASEHLWMILVKQAKIIAIQDGIEIILYGILWIIAYKYILFLLVRIGGIDIYNSAISSEYRHKSTGVYVLGITLICTLVIITFFLALSDCYELITGFYNPEYLAFKKILEQLK